MARGCALTDSPEKTREAFRWLLLPVQVDLEGDAVAAALEELGEMGIGPEDAPTWVHLELEAWRSAGEASADFEAVVAAYIGVADDDLAQLLASRYFSLHHRLAAQPLIDHDGASTLLSHARLISLLAAEERLSAAQIAKLVSVRDNRAPIVWQHVEMVLAELGLAPSLRVADVEATYEVDQELELEVFADADESVCAQMVADAGAHLGFPGDLLESLKTLLPADRTPNGPYLQMLHFQCVIAEYFDHALSAVYEFKPRGQASKWLFEKYPDSLEVADNPFLNNAKSVDQLGEAWARSKKPDKKAEAHALVQIIDGLDRMGFAARRELASWLRQLLVRRIRLAEGISVALPDSLAPNEIRRLFDTVAKSESGTRGILEQRLMDAVSSLRHPSPRWIARGLKDSVNATNVSRRKCGDCDFQNAAMRDVVAYEAHAGRLTDLYVQAHLRTLDGVLEQRAQEWAENVGPELDWSVTVIFVAHELNLTELPIPKSFDGGVVQLEATTYRDFFGDIDESDPDVGTAVREYVMSPLTLQRTPDSVRRTLLDLIGA